MYSDQLRKIRCIFFCGRNSVADIAKPDTFIWSPLADEVLDAAYNSPTRVLILKCRLLACTLSTSIQHYYILILLEVIVQWQ